MSDFRAKIQQLEQELAKSAKIVENPPSVGGMNTPSMMTIASIIAPIIYFATLYFWSPKIVSVKSGKKHERSLKKVFLASLTLTILTWVGMYGYTSYKNSA